MSYTATPFNFLQLFFHEDETICFRAFPPKGQPGEAVKISGSLHELSNSPSLHGTLTRHNSRLGIYFVVNFGGNTDNDIQRFNACFAESDKHPIEEQHQKLDACHLPPTARIETARSVHAYWKLHGNVPREAWYDAQNRLIQYFAGDPAIKNPSRVMRVPGFDHIGKDGVTRTPVRVVQFDPERVYSISELLTALPATSEQNRKVTLRGKLNGSGGNGFVTWDALRAELGRKIMAQETARENQAGNWDCRGICHDGEGNTGLFYVPATNQAYCNSHCDQSTILRAFGLPEEPDKAPAAEGSRSERSVMSGNPTPMAGVMDREEELNPSKLKVVNARELLTMQIPPREHLLAPILQTQSTNMVFSKRGVGKTHISLGIACAIAAGGKFLRWEAPKPRRVLYIDGEMPAVSMKERFAAIVLGMDADIDPEYFRLITPDLQAAPLPSLSGTIGQSQVEDELGDTELVILDNISTLTTGKENESDSWMPIQQWVLSLRRRGISVLLVHHAGRNGEQRGTSKREDILDAMITLKHPPDYATTEGARFEVHFTKARNIHGPDAEPFEVRMETRDGVAVWTMSSLDDVTEARARELLDDGVSIREAAKELGIHRSRVERIKKKFGGAS